MAQPSGADVFALGEILGKGGFGRVHRAVCTPTGQTVAIKILAPSHDAEAMATEVEMLRVCRCSHIVAYHGAFRHEPSGMLWICMECCEGSVLDVMTATEQCLTERQCATVMAAALDGLLYLHQRQIMHRDVKAANILLTADGGVKVSPPTDVAPSLFRQSDGPAFALAQLGDFGVATRLSSSLSARNTLVGTAAWLAPEVAVGSNARLAVAAGFQPGVGYGKKADVRH